MGVREEMFNVVCLPSFYALPVKRAQQGDYGDP